MSCYVVDISLLYFLSAIPSAALNTFHILAIKTKSNECKFNENTKKTLVGNLKRDFVSVAEFKNELRDIAFLSQTYYTNSK